MKQKLEEITRPPLWCYYRQPDEMSTNCNICCIDMWCSHNRLYRASKHFYYELITSTVTFEGVPTVAFTFNFMLINLLHIIVTSVTFINCLCIHKKF